MLKSLSDTLAADGIFFFLAPPDMLQSTEEEGEENERDAYREEVGQDPVFAHSQLLWSSKQAED